MKTVRLLKGREASVKRRHPWLFSGAIQSPAEEPARGETVLVQDATGNDLAVAAWSPASRIRARIWSFDPLTGIEPAFFRQRLRQALARRHHLLESKTRSAFRLIYGESDGLPGLVVDCYGDYLVCQFLFAGVEHWKNIIVEELSKLFVCKGIFERSDAAVRSREGLEPVTGVLWGEAPPETLDIMEYGAVYEVDVVNGHKTGFYLDQAENRHLVGRLAAGCDAVLNCFAYTGGFAVAALRGGAKHVINVDSSAPALSVATRNMQRNDLDDTRFTNTCANVFEQLRTYRTEGQHFDMVILDPPKFADNKVQIKKASRAYKDIALQAAALVNPGGLLVTFSCSGAIEPALFQKITADAFLDAGRQGQIILYLHQSGDHPVALPFPESQYLKGLVCRVD